MSDQFTKKEQDKTQIPGVDKERLGGADKAGTTQGNKDANRPSAPQGGERTDTSRKS